jgi:nucleoside-diphosphate-sugar epimerase
LSVLVTGATGFIGPHLVQRLVGAGEQVAALVRPETDASRLLALGVEVLRGDVRDRAAVRRAVAGRRIVYHLARALGGSDARTLVAVNGEGTAQVARAADAAGVERIVHAGSASVYGHIVPGVVLREDSPLRPDSAYGRSKLLGERALFSAGGAVAAVIARIPAVLGPGAHAWRATFGSIESRRFRMLGAGDNRYHLVDVADLVDGLLLCGTTQGVEGRIYNLAGPEPIRLRDMVQLIARELGAEGGGPRPLPAAPFRLYHRLSEVTERIAGIRLPRAAGVAFLLTDRVLDITRARRELGYAPRVEPREAIGRTAEWIRQGATRLEVEGATASGPR